LNLPALSDDESEDEVQAARLERHANRQSTDLMRIVINTNLLVSGVISAGLPRAPQTSSPRVTNANRSSMLDW
jgi:hypothetical protein